jgi:DNA-binding NarL/FixJ family response regulator
MLPGGAALCCRDTPPTPPRAPADNLGSSLLAEAVRAAMTGESLVSPSVTVRLLKHLTAPQPSASLASPASLVQPQEPLTDRELDVVRLVAVGRTNVEIAAWAWQTGHARTGA